VLFRKQDFGSSRRALSGYGILPDYAKPIGGSPADKRSAGTGVEDEVQRIRIVDSELRDDH